MTAEPQIVLCTVPDREVAERIATDLVGEGLAACVNIVPGITSVYRWQDAIEKDTELLLIIKTASTVFATLTERIKSMHPYELPEIVTVAIGDGLPGYLDWITDSIVDAR
jgi:periplasmic divalent cation tolerance protein